MSDSEPCNGAVSVSQVRTAERDGRASGWVVRGRCRGAGGAIATVRSRLRCRSHGVCGGRWHHSWSSSQVRSTRHYWKTESADVCVPLKECVCVFLLQWEWQAGLVDIHSRLRRDDVIGCGPWLRLFIGRNFECHLTALKEVTKAAFSWCIL